MEYREVGNTGVRVSEIGFGGGGNAGLMVKGSPEQQREAIGRAIELGINYFDQAPDYGDGVSETNLGRVLKELGVRPYITTKIEVRESDLGDIAGHVERSLDQSLSRLGHVAADEVSIRVGFEHVLELRQQAHLLLLNMSEQSLAQLATEAMELGPALSSKFFRSGFPGQLRNALHQGLDHLVFLVEKLDDTGLAGVDE